MWYKTLGRICFSVLIALSILVSIFYIYFRYFDDSVTTGTNNINDQVALDVVSAEDVTEEEKAQYADRWLIHANYYSNSKNNGLELQEVQYNYFTGTNLTQDEYWSTGMQFIGNFRTYITTVANKKEANSFVAQDFCYYDTTNGISWMGFKGQSGGIGKVLNRDAYMIIKIDDKPYRIKLTGQYTKYGKFLFWDVKKSIVYFDYGDVFDCIMSAIKTNSRGYGDYYIKINLSQYFTVEEYNAKTKRFEQQNADFIENLAIIKFHYDENGATNASQSLFGIIDCNPQYNEIDTDYWQERVVYNLTDDDLTYRYSEAYGGYFVGLTLDKIEMLNSMPRSIVNVVIDLDSKYLLLNKYNVLGLDYNAFEGLKIDTVQFTSSKPITLLLNNKCLYNTNLTTLKHTSNITLNMADDAINSKYVEVVE